MSIWLKVVNDLNEKSQVLKFKARLRGLPRLSVIVEQNHAEHRVHPTLRQAQGPLVGVAAFSGSFPDSSQFRQSDLVLSHPQVTLSL
jgi:hypothetical protein